jgi:hypothetical protein
MAEVATNCPQDRLLYQGQVRSQLEQMGDLGEVNLYESLPEAGTEKPGLSKSNSEEPPYLLPVNLELLVRKLPPEDLLPLL